MTRKIFVSGYCHAPSAIKILRVILYQDAIDYLPYPDLDSEESRQSFLNQIRIADVWVTSDYFSLGEFVMRDGVNNNLIVLKWPEVSFAAFHPDIAYALTGSRYIQSAGADYNSAICLWAWKNQIEIDRAVSLFSARIFRDLGYLNLWDPSVDKLRARFTACALDFDRFFLSVKRHGIFMHTINHSKVFVSVQICMQLAVKLGVDRCIFQEALENIIPDERLDDWVWPVYPEIGDALGVASSYRWKFRDQYWPDLRSFVEDSYAAYERQKIDASTISCDRFTGGLFDRTLGAFLRGAPE